MVSRAVRGLPPSIHPCAQPNVRQWEMQRGLLRARLWLSTVIRMQCLHTAPPSPPLWLPPPLSPHHHYPHHHPTAVSLCHHITAASTMI